jgi:carbon monoxide dehydrogenase subunit G
VNVEQTFEVQAPIDAVWEAVNDLERIAPCLPGAVITGHENGTYEGEFTLRVGPFAAVHKGTVQIVAADATTRVSQLVVRGSNGSGSGATIVSTLADLGGATRVDAVAELTIAGALAGFVGPTVIQDISTRLLRDFATCLSSRLAEPDCGVCGGEVPPLIGDVLTGTGLTLAQAAARVERGETVPELTPVQQRIVEDFLLRGGAG